MATKFSGVFPPQPEGFTEKEDAQFYGIKYEDDTISSKMEMGIERTRSRFTKPPSRIYTTGFTEISQADFDLLEEFWEEYRKAKIFTWTNPADQKTHSVRFAEVPSVAYSGVGPHRSYTVEVSLKQV